MTDEWPPMSPVTRRLLTANEDEPDDPAYLHTVMCQTSMPYRRTTERRWQHRNGRALLQIEAGYVEDPDVGEFVEVGLPWGPRPRIALAHLNGEALRQGTRHIEVEDTITAFVRRVLGRTPNGREMRDFRGHLTSLSTATVRLSFQMAGGGRYQSQGQIVSGLELWDGSDERQRTLWPAQVSFSEDYWKSLSGHAVPLDQRHVAALAHSAMALDIYAWLAQRLHRIKDPKGAFVPWSKLQEQFGHGYSRLDNFRRVFRRELRQVCAVYQDARVGEEIDGRGQPFGIRLEHSKPPVLRRG